MSQTEEGEHQAWQTTPVTGLLQSPGKLRKRPVGKFLSSCYILQEGPHQVMSTELHSQTPYPPAHDPYRDLSISWCVGSSVTATETRLGQETKTTHIGIGIILSLNTGYSEYTPRMLDSRASSPAGDQWDVCLLENYKALYIELRENSNTLSLDYFRKKQ